MSTAHVILRVKRRYGLDITVADVDRMEADILSGRARFSLRKDEATSLWWVAHGETRILVVFSERCRRIVTVLPEDHERTRYRKGGWSKAESRRRLKRVNRKFE